VKHSAASNANDPSTYVRDMTVDQLHDLIGGAVSLATAMTKSSGHAAAPEDVSQAAKSVVGVMQQAKETADSSSNQPQGRHILWVDDRPDNNVYERSAFEAMGFSFRLALSTSEALQILREERFAGIISDMGRREGPTEGYVLLNAIRSKGDQTPFFIYAGSNAPKHEREAAEQGAQGSTNEPRELFELVTGTIN
jgi:CheY-like chemotaxis protein